MRPNMRPTEKTDLKGALRSLTVYLQKSLGVIHNRETPEFRETLNGFLRLWLTRHGISFLPASLITGNISYHQTR